MLINIGYKNYLTNNLTKLNPSFCVETYLNLEKQRALKFFATQRKELSSSSLSNQQPSKCKEDV